MHFFFSLVFDMTLVSNNISSYSVNLCFEEVRDSSLFGDANFPWKNCHSGGRDQDLGGLTGKNAMIVLG
jgi:hypothetical protein